MTTGPRLRAITIRGFRGIDHLDLMLTDSVGETLDTVVLSGANGAGKTSLLEAILLLLNRHQLIDYGPYGLVRTDGEPIVIGALREGPAGRLDVQAPLIQGLVESADSRPKQVSLGTPFAGAVEYLSAWRRIDPEGRPDWLGAGDAAMLRLRSAWGRLRGGEIPWRRLGAGGAALLALIGPLVLREHPPDIVLIDEPEQHLGVQWQQLLVGWLRTLAPAAQFILATHSEEILRSVPSHQRFSLVKDGP